MLLRAVYDGDAPFGIKPPGSKIDFLTNTSSAWQVFDALVTNREKAAARVWTGTDGVLGPTGGAPGIDIQKLMGVAATLVQGDLRCIERGTYEGLYSPWAACNYGSSVVAPRRNYLIPDADADAVADSFAKRNQAFFADCESVKRGGFVLTQDVVDTLAQKHQVHTQRLLVAMPGPAQDGDDTGQEEPPAPDDAARLAQRMTDLGLPACEHGRKNRCPLCGVERDRDVDVDPDTGEPVWKIAWKPIGAPPASE